MKLSAEIQKEFKSRGAIWATQKQATAAGSIDAPVIKFGKKVSPGVNATLYRVWAQFDGDLSTADPAAVMIAIDAAAADVDAAIARGEKPAAFARLRDLEAELAALTA